MSLSKGFVLTLWPLLMSVGVLVCVFPGSIKAEGPVLDLTAQARSVQSAGGWGTSVSAEQGDTVLLWFVVKNTVSGTVANNAQIKVDLPSGSSNLLILTVHAKADNASEVTQNVNINLIGPSSTISYVPGGDAAFITNGVTTKITPDQDGANMSSQFVSIGNINGGDFSYAKVLGTTMIAPQTTSAPTATPTPTEMSEVSSGVFAATGSAVASSTPNTGVDEVWWSTLVWLGVGAGGYSLRKWAHRMSV